jgi:site-specific recombinase XerD
MLRGLKMSQSNTHIDTFLQDLALTEVSPQTLKAYRIDLYQFLKWFEETNSESFEPAAVTRTDLRDYRSFLMTVEKRQPATVNRRLAALRKFFLWAQARGMVTDSPTEGVKYVEVQATAPKWLEKREIDKLIRAVERHGNKRDLALVLTLRHTGIRVSELSALRLSDLEISVRKGRLIVRSGKGRKFRSVPLNLDVRKAIENYLEVRPNISDDHVFISRFSRGIDPRTVERLVEKYARFADLEGVTPHTLRHSFGKHTLDAGGDLVTVSSLLGHQRLETTAIYTTPSERDKEAAVDRLASE